MLLRPLPCRYGTDMIAILYSPWRSNPCRVILLIRFQITCSILAILFTLLPTLGLSHEQTEGPDIAVEINSSGYSANSSNAEQNIQIINITQRILPNNGTKVADQTKPAETVYVPREFDSEIPREYPTALVIASSVAAVSILVFFFLAYCWHTHQLDSRARKLAIRLAADAEQGMRRRNCPAQSRVREGRSVSRPVSEASPDRNHYEALTMEDDPGHGSDCGRSSRGVSESDAGDSEDLFMPSQLQGLGDRGRSLTRSGRGGHRKWNRSRKHSSGANLDKRDSAVTDKEILTHFASRRHSTFFI